MMDSPAKRMRADEAALRRALALAHQAVTPARDRRRHFGFLFDGTSGQSVRDVVRLIREQAGQVAYPVRVPPHTDATTVDELVEAFAALNGMSDQDLERERRRDLDLRAAAAGAAAAQAPSPSRVAPCALLRTRDAYLRRGRFGERALPPLGGRRRLADWGARLFRYNRPDRYLYADARWREWVALVRAQLEAEGDATLHFPPAAHYPLFDAWHAAFVEANTLPWEDAEEDGEADRPTGPPPERLRALAEAGPRLFRLFVPAGPRVVTGVATRRPWPWLYHGQPTWMAECDALLFELFQCGIVFAAVPRAESCGDDFEAWRAAFERQNGGAAAADKPLTQTVVVC